MEDQSLTISKSNALKAFRNAGSEGKLLLENLFGKEVLNEKITDRIKSYPDACAELGLNPLTEDDFENITPEDIDATYAYHQLTIIARALNQGWKPDYSNTSQYKYYPYFYWQQEAVGGSGFSFHDCDYGASSVGSRLNFKSRELAEYAGRQFQSIYNRFLSPQ